MSGPFVTLFFMNRAPGGGSTSFAVNLYRGFELAGIGVQMYRVTERGEHSHRTLAKYDGVRYMNVDPATAVGVVKSGATPCLLVAACPAKDTPWAPDIITQLLRAGMRAVVHDPNEFKIYDHLPAVQELAQKGRPPIAIRPTMREHIPECVVLPHPYVRKFSRWQADAGWYDDWKARPLHAASVARVSFVKRTTWILDANRLLPPTQRVALRGAENRLYTRHKLREAYPEFVQGSVGFPLAWHASAEELVRARAAVDMTYFPGDGGGTQYSFMEAWDAGAACVLASDWLRYRGEMQRGANCLAADGGEELARLLANVVTDSSAVASVVQGGYAALRRHDAATVARAFYGELTR